MKKSLKAALVIFPLFLLFSGCSSSASRPESNLAEPEIQLVQLQVPSNLRYGGVISVKFQLQVENKSPEAIVLRKLDLKNVGSGAYVLRSRPLFFNTRFPPNRAAAIEFWAEAYARGGVLGADEPVAVRGIAYFDTANGQLHKVFTQILSEFGEGRQ